MDSSGVAALRVLLAKAVVKRSVAVMIEGVLEVLPDLNMHDLEVWLSEGLDDWVAKQEIVETVEAVETEEGVSVGEEGV